MTNTDLFDFDHSDRKLVEDPYPTYRRMRDECPVARGSKFGGFWVLSRYDDVLAAELDPGTYASGDGITIPALGGGLPTPPLECDPPEHRDFRSILQPLFTRAAAQRYEPRIREITRECIESFRHRGSADFATDLAAVLPPLVIAELFGLPARDCEHFRRLATEIVGGADTPEGVAAGTEMLAYLGGVLAERATNPSDDLASLIAHARLPHRELTNDERLGMALLMVVAGHETTVASIAAMLALVGRDSALQEQLRADPSLIPAAVEESLRLEAPVQNFARTTRCPVNVHGVDIAEGDRVMLVYGAANRDERKFADPESFRVDRRGAAHLSFGAGIHRCLGAPLGQLEMRVVLEEVLALLPPFAVDFDAVEVEGMIARVFVSVPATWEEKGHLFRNGSPGSPPRASGMTDLGSLDI
jgi:cytochrome P450